MNDDMGIIGILYALSDEELREFIGSSARQEYLDDLPPELQCYLEKSWEALHLILSLGDDSLHCTDEDKLGTVGERERGEYREILLSSETTSAPGFDYVTSPLRFIIHSPAHLSDRHLDIWLTESTLVEKIAGDLALLSGRRFEETFRTLWSLHISEIEENGSTSEYIGEDDWGYLWSYLRELPDLYRRAAAAGRNMVLVAA